MATDLYPILRKAKEVGYEISLVVGQTVADESKTAGPSNIFLMNVREDKWLDTALSALKDLGVRRKSKDQDFRA